MSAQSKAALQAAGTAGKSAMNAAAGTVNAQIDTGTLDGAAYAAQLAKGIAEIKAAQQKQLEEQLKQQAKEIAAQQKAAAKANAKAEKKKEQAEQSAQTEQGARDDENAAKGQWTPWGEQSPVVGPVRNSGSTKKPSEETADDETKEEKKGLWQKFEEWGRSELPAEQQLHEELRQKAAKANQAQTDEKAQKVAELKALNRSQAKAREESRAARETNAGLLNKSKLNDSEKAEIYMRVNTWAENPENKSLMTALQMAKTKNRIGDLLEAGYTSQQLDEANEMLELYQKMGKWQVLKERVGGTAKGTVKTAVSAGMMGADTAMQTAENAVASVKDEEYRNAVKQYNDALLKTQTMEDSNTAYTLDENGNSVQTEEYQKAWQQLNDARAVMDRKDKEINAPVSKDTSGYKMYQSAQEDLSRSDLGLDAGTKILKGAATSAAENIAIAAVNPALVLPVLSAQGAAGGMANSIEKEAPAVNTLSNGMAKFMAGWAINSVGVEQMLDTMGASGARNTIAAQIVQSIKNNSKLAQTNPAFYAVLMGAGDNGLQSFAETWADRAIDLATNTAEPMSLQELAAQSLQEAASGALGGAMTAVAGLGVNAGRQAAYARAQNAQDARNAQMAPENAQNIMENAQTAQIETAPDADNLKATGDNLPPVQQVTDYKNTAAAAGAAGERAGSEPMLRAVPMESVPEEMQQVAREISESTGARVEYFESDNPRALGAYENGTLSLNKSLNTKEAAQQTIVHEFTHWMEGTNTYSKMRQYMMDSRILQEAARAATGLNEPPQGMSWAEAWQQKILEDYAAAGIQADAEKEMVAKMCEKYLFSGEDAVNKICHENMSLAETVLDWVREMISRVRGATMEAELRHIERLYRKGIAEAKGQAEQENKEKRYKVLEDAYSGQSFVQVDEDILNGVPKSQWAKTVREEMKRRYPNGVKIGGWTVHVNADSRSEFVNSKSSQWMESKDRTAYKDKLRMISNLEEIINIANNVRNEGIKHKRKDNYKSFNRAEALIRVGGNGYVADVVTAIKPSTKEVFYDIVNISRQKIKENRPKRYSAEPASTGTGQSSFGDNIAPDDNIVKPGNGKQFSIADTDSEENALAERQRAMEETAEKAFAKSEVRDENGKLLPVYHATDESFTRFRKNKLGSFTKDVASDDSMFATAKMGFWFNEKDLRERTAQSKSIKAYLNIENPYETSLYELANLLESSEGNTPGKKAENLRRELQNQGYDGLAVQDDEFGGKSYVAFEPNQIKSAEPVTYNNSGKEIPLSKRFNKNKEDIRFSLADTDSDGNTLTAQQRSYFKDSKIVDEDGNLRVVYHGSSENFNTFDVSKGRANMDIQGSFFSPWDIDAQGYGDNVRAFYLNIKNPAPEGVAYKALNAHKGENGAGIKAREDLIRMGYDGVNNSDEEYIAFYPEQIKLIDNETPTKDTDIRFSLEENEGTVSREEISRGRFARAAKARENGDSMLRALFVEEDIAEETMRVMETVKNESWRILRDTEESQRTAGQKVLDRSANGIAWALKREYHSSADRAGLKEQLIGLYADMEGKNITMEEAVGRAREIGRELVQTARPERRANTELMDAYGDAYQSLTGQVIRITDSEMQSILHRWGSLREFRRDTGNKIRVSTENGVPIDALWGKLSETNPGKFEADTNDGDRVDAIANFVNELRPQEVQRYAGVERETAEEIGERIIDGFVDGKVRTEKERVRKEVQKEVRRQVKKGVERLNADNYEYRQELGKEKKKIERMAERMGKKLARPTKQQHIVADADVQRVVQSIADDALAIVTGRFAGEDKLPYVGRKLVALSNSLSHLATTDHRYAGFMTVDADGNTVPVEFVRNLNDLAEAMNKIHQENPSISDLDLETARKLRETLERVEHELETADKLLSNTIGAEHRESVEKTAKQIYKEINGARKVSTNSKSVGAKLLRALDDKNVGYALTILNPMRVARMMTNYSKDSAFVEVVDALNKGQRKMMLLKGQASAIFKDVTNSQFTLGFDKNARRSKTGLGYTKADYDGFSGRSAQRLDVGFRDADTGEVVYITPAMRAELAMHLMNPHNRDRVLYGGLMVPDAEALCKGDTEKAQRLSHYVRFDISNPAAAYEIVAKVVDGMSDYENQWVKAAQRYFWDFSGKEYNKTTVQLWGYEAANVANYYPAASDDKNLHKNVAQRSQENYTVENNSNLKDRVYDATKPIALNEINRTTLKSIDTMSRFCGLALPMRDFEKIYNYNSEFTASGSSENIKSAMNRAWNGKAGIYWENALEDMNGGRSKRKDALSRFFAKARGNYATAVLYGNASTAMKQAASFPTAAAAIGWKPLADGLANYNKEGAKTLEEINKRVATYSMRNGDGNSVYDAGDTSGAVARLVNSMPGAGWITAADDLTVKVLSTAAKAYVDQNIGNLKKGSAEYWDKVADVYADCIELTQPNNGTMQLSALSRSQNEISRGVTMFSNQRIQNLGLMWDAVADLRAQKARLKDAPNDADAKAEFSRAKEKFANTMSAMAVQSVTIGLMTAAGRALWHREDEYRDELGEITSKSLWKKIMDDSLDSFMSNFIGIADIVDVGRFLMDKNYTHYDFSVPELEMINGLVTKGRNMMVAIGAELENDDPEKADALDEKMKKSVLAFVEQAGQGLGVPLVNLRKNVLGVFNGVRGIAEGNGWFGEYQYTAKNVRSMISGYMDGRYDLAGANEMLEKYCASKYGKAFGDMEKSERDKAASDMREQIAKDWKGLYVQATDEERAELAEKLGDIRVGDRKLFTSKAMQAWVDSAEKAAQEKATKDRADRLYADAVDGLAGQRLYKNMSEEEQINLESSLNEAAKTAAKLEAGYMKAEKLGAGERYLWNYAGKNADKWLALEAKYATVTQKAKAGTDGAVKMEAFLRALESSGYSTEEQAALLQAKGGNSKLEKAKAETRISYYRAQVYGDTNGNGSLSQSEFKDYVEKSGMSRSTADEIWNMLWAPGKTGSSSPYR